MSGARRNRQKRHQHRQRVSSRGLRKYLDPSPVGETSVERLYQRYLTTLGLEQLAALHEELVEERLTPLREKLAALAVECMALRAEVRARDPEASAMASPMALALPARRLLAALEAVRHADAGVADLLAVVLAMHRGELDASLRRQLLCAALHIAEPEIARLGALFLADSVPDPLAVDDPVAERFGAVIAAFHRDRTASERFTDLCLGLGISPDELRRRAAALAAFGVGAPVHRN